MIVILNLGENFGDIQARDMHWVDKWILQERAHCSLARERHLLFDLGTEQTATNPAPAGEFLFNYNIKV